MSISVLKYFVQKDYSRAIACLIMISLIVLMGVSIGYKWYHIVESYGAIMGLNICANVFSAVLAAALGDILYENLVPLIWYEKHLFAPIPGPKDWKRRRLADPLVTTILNSAATEYTNAIHKEEDILENVPTAYDPQSRQNWLADLAGAEKDVKFHKKWWYKLHTAAVEAGHKECCSSHKSLLHPSAQGLCKELQRQIENQKLQSPIAQKQA